MSVAKEIDELADWVSEIPVSIDALNYTLVLMLLLIAKKYGDEEIIRLAEKNLKIIMKRLERWYYFERGED